MVGLDGALPPKLRASNAYGKGSNPPSQAYNPLAMGNASFAKRMSRCAVRVKGRCAVRARTLTTRVDELCLGPVVHVVEVFLSVCPSLLINATTLKLGLMEVHERIPCLRPGNVEQSAKMVAVLVKMALSKWRDIAVYPEKFARAMLQANLDQKRIITKLKGAISPYEVTANVATCDDWASTTSVAASTSRSSSFTRGSSLVPPSSPPTTGDADLDFERELEALDHALPPAAVPLVCDDPFADGEAWLSEFCPTFDANRAPSKTICDNRQTTPSKTFTTPVKGGRLRRTWSDEFDELGMKTPTKNAGNVVDEDNEINAFFDQITVVTPNHQEPRAPLTNDEVRARADAQKIEEAMKEPLCAKAGALSREHNNYLAKFDPKRARSNNSHKPHKAVNRSPEVVTIASAAAVENCEVAALSIVPDNLNGHALKKKEKPKGIVKTGRAKKGASAYKNSMKKSAREKVSPEVAKERAREARLKAGMDWDATQLYGQKQ